jgi:ATP-dependent Lon protease
MAEATPEQNRPPAEALIILPVREVVLFPGLVMPLAIARAASIAAAQEAVRGERPVGILMQTDAAVEEPTPEQLHPIGTTAQILRYVTAPDGAHHLVCQGLRRFRATEFIPGFPYPVARMEEIGVAEVMTPEIEARLRLLKERAREALSLLPAAPAELAAAIESLTSPSALADFIAGISDSTPQVKQEILETIDIGQRMDKVLAMLAQRIEVLKISKTIGEQTQQTLSSQQREYVLREQLRQIQ